MGVNKQILIFNTEIIYNQLGQIFFKRRFISRYIMYFYRYILRGS